MKTNKAMKTTMTIEQLAEKMNQKVWSKGDLKRIYLNNEGWNTKKMSTKTYIWQNEKGEFIVNCRIECPSQSYNWIDSQEQQVIDSVNSRIERILFNEEHPDVDYDEYMEEQKEKAKEAAEKKAADFAKARPKLLAVRYLKYSMRPKDYLFENLLDYFSQTAYSDGLFSALSYNHEKGVGFPKSENISEISFKLDYLDYEGGRKHHETVTIPVTKRVSSKKYNYYVVNEETFADYLPESYIKMWEETKKKTAIFNQLLQEKINEILIEVQEFEHLLPKFSFSETSTDENRKLVEKIKESVNEMYK